MNVDNVNRILSLIKEAESIDGRKKFQKIVYILQSKGVLLQEKFKYYYYGPYSSDLQLEMDELVDNGTLVETKKDNTYSYELNSSKSFDSVDEIIEKKDLINLLNQTDSRILELTSTIYFLNKERVMDQKVVKEKLISLKPHLSSFIDKAFELQNQIDVGCWNN